jgi:hypothetical protein
VPDRTDEPHGGAKAARLVRWDGHAGAGVVSQEEKRAFSKIPILDRRNGLKYLPSWTSTAKVELLAQSFRGSYDVLLRLYG